MIKKLILCAFLLTICTFFVNAQRIKGALTGGVNISQVDGDEVYGYRKWGINAGPSAIVPLSEKWSIGIELLYNQKGSYQKRQSFDSTFVISGTDTTWITGQYKLRLNYAEVPIMAYYTDKKIITVGTGFSWGRLVGVKEWEHGKLNENTDLNGPYDKDDFCWLADIRFRVYKKLHFNVRYAYSINKIRTRTFESTDQSRQWKRDQYNNVVSFKLIYIFNENLENFDKVKK
jgi:hypothetical protein